MTRTSGGVPLTDEMLDALADAAENLRPDQITWTKLPGRPRLSEGEGPSSVLSVRVDDDLGAALKLRAEAEGRSTSEITREALRHYLAS